MPFVDPQTIHNPATSTIAPASWGDAVRDAAVYLATSKPRALVYNSASISIPNNTLTAVTFDGEFYDVGGCHSTSSSTSRLTVPTGEGGVYNMGACVRFAASATGSRAVRIKLNGTTYIASQFIDVNSSVAHELTISKDYSLAAGDYIEMFVFQTSGSALFIEQLGNYAPHFWFRWTATT